jgi:hypothetical protein
MGPAGHAVGSGRRVASATAADHLGFGGVCPPTPHEATRRMAQASRGQGWICQPQEAMGHEKICGITSMLAEQQTLCFIVVCTLEKLWFLATFGDIPFWHILASCLVIPYISSYPCVTTLMLWGHGRSVAPETSSIAGGARFRLNTSYHRPDPLVT